MIQFVDGKLLFVDGKLAMHADCCCDDCCGSQPSASVSVSGSCSSECSGAVGSYAFDQCYGEDVHYWEWLDEEQDWTLGVNGYGSGVWDCYLYAGGGTLGFYRFSDAPITCEAGHLVGSFSMPGFGICEGCTATVTFGGT